MNLPEPLLKALTRNTSLGEKELWPEFFWALASLLKAGYLPAQAFAALAQTQGRRPAPQGIKEQIEHSARYRGERDLLAFLHRAEELSRHGYSLAGILADIGLMREHSRQRLRELLACLNISERTGAPLVHLMEDLARYCEQDIDAELARESAMSAPVTTGKILSLLPVLGLVLGMLMGTDPVGVLFGSIPGAFLALLGGGLALGGHRWTKRLVAEAENSAEVLP